MIVKGRGVLPRTGRVQPGNAVVYAGVPGYDLVLLGAFRKLADYPEAPVCFDKEVEALYAAEAAKYFFPEEAFSFYQDCFKKLHGQVI